MDKKEEEMKKESDYYQSLLKKKEVELTSHWDFHHVTLGSKEDALRKALQNKVDEFK
jgi:hypothetical protein